jgi:chromosomal replication initiation ATPase DnaA
MQQLPLDVRLADHAVFESFHATGNELLVHQLRTVATTPGQPPLWLWAPAGQGKTHLLQATVALADYALIGRIAARRAGRHGNPRSGLSG